MAYFSIENIGHVPAHDVMISFAPEPPWKHATKPPLLERGMKYLAPRRRHLLYYQSLIDIFKENSNLPSEFTATASYLHPVAMNRVSDSFIIDFRDYLHAAAVDSDIVEQGKSIENAIQKLVSELKGVKEWLERIAAIAGPTGLDLSVRTIQNLLHVKRDDGLVEKLDPVGQEPPFFEEVLGVDSSMADVLMQHFWSGAEFGGLDEIPGMTSELKSKIEARLTWRTESEADT